MKVLSEEIALEMIQYFEQRPNYVDWIRTIASLKCQFGVEIALRILLSRFKDEKPDEHLKQLNRELDKIGTGTFIKMATDRGYQWNNKIKNQPPSKSIAFNKGGTHEYWYQYMDRNVANDFVRQEKIIPLSDFSFRTKGRNVTILAHKNNPIFAFHYSDNTYKIYKPNETRKQFKYQWFNYQKDGNSIIWGINNLDESFDYILIVEGLKDFVVAKANGINAIGLDSVYTKLEEEFILELCQKFKKVILCLDNDDAGRKRSVELTAQFSLEQLHIPDNIKGYQLKDISEIIKYSRSHDISIIDNLKNEIANFPDNAKTLKRKIRNKDESRFLFTCEGLNDKIYNNLPEDFQKLLSVFDSIHEKDMFLLSALVIISGILPKYKGFYHRKYYYANLYLYIVAPAASGKGVLEFSRALAKLIDDSIKTGDDIVSSESSKNYYSLFIPANSSSSGFLELLNNNSGSGILFETEGDTLANIHKSEYGNYSDSFRKAFHHENISMYRRGNKELIRIEEPRLSCVLSGTPNQVKNLIPSAENGLMSRFVFYLTNVKPEMDDVFNEKKFIDNNHFDKFAEKLFDIWQKIRVKDKILFVLTDQQKTIFQQKFEEYVEESENEIVSITLRMGLISFRLMMILSVFRGHDISSVKQIECNDKDFYNVLEIVDVLMKHSFAIFEMLPNESIMTLDTKKQEFIDALPQKVSRKDALELANKQGIKRATIDRLLNSNIFNKLSRGEYEKK